MSLEGRHALVTGGGSGIGLAIARKLAAAGARVTITGRRATVLETAGDIHGLHPVMMDVTVEASIANAIQQAVRMHGPITICVANAELAEARALHKTELSFWRRIMQTNLEGTFLTIRDCLHGMRAEGWGRAIAISSAAGLRGVAGAPAYTASRHGVIGLIRSLSEDYRDSGITFNALCPGMTDGEIALRSPEAETEAERALRPPSATCPARLVVPEEVAAAALWLCGPDTAGVNGQTIEIAGGQL